MSSKLNLMHVPSHTKPTLDNVHQNCLVGWNKFHAPNNFLFYSFFELFKPACTSPTRMHSSPTCNSKYHAPRQAALNGATAQAKCSATKHVSDGSAGMLLLGFHFCGCKRLSLHSSKTRVYVPHKIFDPVRFSRNC